MLDQAQTPEFSDHDLEVIREALLTQEKILAVQARAGGNRAKTRLANVRRLLQGIRHQRSGENVAHRGFWGQFTRVIYG